MPLFDFALSLLIIAFGCSNACRVHNCFGMEFGHGGIKAVFLCAKSLILDLFDFIINSVRLTKMLTSKIFDLVVNF